MTKPPGRAGRHEAGGIDLVCIDPVPNAVKHSGGDSKSTRGLRASPFLTFTSVARCCGKEKTMFFANRRGRDLDRDNDRRNDERRHRSAECGRERGRDDRPAGGGAPARTMLLLAGMAAAAACSKTPSTVLTTVYVDDTVPPLLALQTVVARASDPTVQISAARQSPFPGDAADRPAPFEFPLSLPVTMDPSFAGEVILTVNGLDWDSGKVLASDHTLVQVIAGQQTTASVTLTATGGAGGAGGGAAGAGGGGRGMGGGAGGAASPEDAAVGPDGP
jgi:hypothetical protein